MTMKIVTVRVGLEALSPLKLDAMSEAVLESLRTGVRLQEDRNRPARDVAQSKLYLDREGHLGLPCMMMYATLRGAGRNVKNGKKQISTKDTTTLFSLLKLRDIFLPFVTADGQPPKWEVDITRGVGRQAKTPTAVAITRPRFDEWALSVMVDIYTDRVSADTVKKLFEEAGATQGLASHRPSCNGPFGCFRIADNGWEVLKNGSGEN